MRSGVAKLLLLLSGGALGTFGGVGCKSAETRPDPTVGAKSSGPTPEVPYASRPGAQSAAGSANGLPSPQPVQGPAGKATEDRGAREAFQAGVDAAQRGDNVGAESQFRRALEREPKLDYAWTNLGVVYERQNRLQDADQAYRKALQLRPDQDAAWDFLARLACRSGRAGEMEGTLRGRVQQYPSALGLRNALIFTLVREGKNDLAAAEAKKVLKADERNVRAMQLLAQVYFREEKMELAKMVLENARVIDPNDAATHNALGLVNLNLKNKPAALDSFKQAATLKPDFAEADNNYGALLNEAQDYDAAAKQLELAVAAAPDFASARLNLGNAYRGRQELQKAAAEYQAVLKLRPQWADTYFNLAILNLDSELPNQDTLVRLKAALSYFGQYRQHGGRDDRVDQYVKDANKGIDRELRKREREKRDQLKKSQAPALSTPGGGAKNPSRGAAKPASRLSDDEAPAPVKARSTTKPKSSGKLGDDEK